MKAVAVITGASSGLGRAFAYQFAREGFDLVLVARRKDQLDEIAEECSRQFGVRVFPMIQDLTHPGAANKIVGFLRQNNLEVEALVNNAGFSVFGPFAHSDPEEEIAMIQLHIHATILLTKQVLAGMLSRKRGHILNVSSVYSLIPVPYQSIYGATKAFLYSFSMALREEVAGQNVHVTLLCPGATATALRESLSGYPDKHAGGMSPERVARLGYRALYRGKKLAIPGTINKIYFFCAKILPVGLLTTGVRWMNQMRGVNVDFR